MPGFQKIGAYLFGYYLRESHHAVESHEICVTKPIFAPPSSILYSFHGTCPMWERFVMMHIRVSTALIKAPMIWCVRENMFPNGRQIGSWGTGIESRPRFGCSLINVDHDAWNQCARQQSEQTRVSGAKLSAHSRQ